MKKITWGKVIMNGVWDGLYFYVSMFVFSYLIYLPYFVFMTAAPEGIDFLDRIGSLQYLYEPDNILVFLGIFLVVGILKSLILAAHNKKI